MKSKYVSRFFNEVAKSKLFDMVGVLVIVCCILMASFVKTGNALAYFMETMHSVWQWQGIWGLIPIGVISLLSSLLSMYSDRLTARLNNFGNWVGLVTVLFSCCVDYVFGNLAAFITYPITFVVQAIAIKKWTDSDQYKAEKPLTGWKGHTLAIAIFAVCMIASFGLNYLGFHSFNAMCITCSIVFGFSITANLFNALKINNQWYYWGLYNIIQAFKAIQQKNLANLGKYIYYIINSLGGISYWVTSRKN